MTFAYSVEGDGGVYDATRTALYPTLNLSIYASDPLAVQANRLRPDGRVEILDEDYGRWSTPALVEAGDSVQIVVTAEAGLSPALVGGVAVGAAALIAAVGLALWRRRSAQPVPPPHARRGEPGEVLSRDDLVAAIAELDLRHRSGAMSRTQWTKRRAELKQLLAEKTSGDRA